MGVAAACEVFRAGKGHECLHSASEPAAMYAHGALASSEVVGKGERYHGGLLEATGYGHVL